MATTRYIQILAELSRDQTILRKAYRIVLGFEPRGVQLQYSPEIIALYLEKVSEEYVIADVARMYETLQVRSSTTLVRKRLRSTSLVSILQRLTYPDIHAFLEQFMNDRYERGITAGLFDFKVFCLAFLDSHHFDKFGHGLTFCWDLIRKYPDDEEVAFQIAKHEPDGIRFASERIRANKEIMLIACCNYALAVRYASPTLAFDREFITSVSQCNPAAIRYIESIWRRDVPIMRIAVSYDSWYIRFCELNATDGLELYMMALRKQPRLFELLHSEVLASPLFQREAARIGITLDMIMEQIAYNIAEDGDDFESDDE